jgi:CheY-like chemotaxis protein
VDVSPPLKVLRTTELADSPVLLAHLYAYSSTSYVTGWPCPSLACREQISQEAILSRILIIDDDVSLRKVLRRILEHAGHTVFDASDGREGVALWHRERTDVVVTDLYMPGKDGIEVILELKHCAAKPKIICMSGRGETEVFDWSTAAVSLGTDGVLVKPFDQRMLLAVIEEVLSR